MHAGCKIKKKKYVQVKQVKMKATYGYGIYRYQGICFIIVRVVSASVPIFQIVYWVLKYDLCVQFLPTNSHKVAIFRQRSTKSVYIVLMKFLAVEV